MVKFIIVMGGVVSGLGKGIITSSIGFLLKKSYRVCAMKLDPYLNVDPGTMNPQEHGEVFVLEDGCETDMDFGHYERFLDFNANRDQNLTMGKVFSEILEKERLGDFLGKTVQMVPQVTNFIVDKILRISKDSKADVFLIELGGTVGDIEAEIFVESLRQLEKKIGKNNISYVFLSYILELDNVLEHKTKPMQQSFKMLSQRGINPNFVILRSHKKLDKDIIRKTSLFTNLDENKIYSVHDLEDINLVPVELNRQNFTKEIHKGLGLKKKFDSKYLNLIEKKINKKKSKQINILIFGKYTKLQDSYISISQSLKHCEYELGVKVNILFEDNPKNVLKNLSKIKGIIIPGGFGKRGIEDKIEVIKIARKNKIPILGICLGMQLMVIEFLRNKCSIKTSSDEFDPSKKDNSIVILEEQKKILNKGATMRLGNYEAKLEDGIIKNLYKKIGLEKKSIVNERHRHRYEVNPKYIDILKKNGMRISGINPKLNLVEFIELTKKEHPYFVGCQAHPELKSKIDKVSPLFYGLVESAKKK